MPRPTDRAAATRVTYVRTARLSLTFLLALAAVAFGQVPAGDRLVDEGRFEEAVAAYGAAIEADGEAAVAYRQRARAKVTWADDLPDGAADAKERLYDEAIADAERAAELAPDDPDAHFEIARALGRAAQYRGVLASLNLAARVADTLDRVLEMDPEHATAWHARALFHHEVPWIAGGRAGLVAPSFERAIELEPRAITHRVGYARVLIDREAWDEAAAQLDAALALPPRTYLDRQDLADARELRAQLP